MSEAVPVCEKCGGNVRRGVCNICAILESGTPPTGHTTACWPLRSEGCAVHPNQIPAAMERNKKHGITGVSYDPADGTAAIDSRQERKKLLKLEGFHDKGGGYGD